MQPISERKAWRFNAFLMIALSLALIVIEVFLIRDMAISREVWQLWIVIPLFLLLMLLPNGFYLVQPNEARVLIVFGKYAGSVRDPGFWWSNPFSVKRRISLRIRNFNSERLKVNDLHGNPIEIAAVIVWRIVDSARAVFDVENYEQFVAIQSETAIRSLALEYPYDAQDEDRSSLRGNPQEVAENLRSQVHARLEIAGVEVMEARISHLAYAQEIAQAMLRRQQAQAVIAARKKIVEGAVGMVEMALRELSEQKIVSLDEEKKATMVNNLLVALVSESQAQPIINTGTLY